MAAAIPDEVQRAIDYAERVAKGSEPAGHWVRLACKRFRADLRAAKSASCRWRFDPFLARAPIYFAGQMQNVKGPEAGQPIRLMDWQMWLLANLFGFVDRETGDRRFRQASVWVPRGNGKSSLAATLALLLTFAEGEGGAEGYTAAVTRDQARIIFDMAKAMAQQDDDFRAEYGVAVKVHAIVQERSASSLRALSSDAKALDGLNVHFAVLDEIGSHKTKAMYDVIITALGKRLQPLLLSISTATDNTTGVGKQVWDYTDQVLRGLISDDRFFGVIYAADQDDDPFDEAVWAKANPGYGRLVQPDHLRALAKQAMASPALKASFQMRHLNIWVGAENALFDVGLWDECADPALDLTRLEGEPCFAAIDMAARVDLAGGALVFPRYDDEGQLFYIVHSQAWLPETAVDAQRNPAYVQWAADGSLAVNAGQTTDFDAIEDWLRDVARRFDLRLIGYDPYMLIQLSQRLRNEGLPMAEYRATTLNFSEPTKLLDAKMRERRIVHDGNAVLRWCLGNVVGHYDARSNVYPKRGNDSAKIDCAIALIMALGVALGSEHATGEIYRDRDLLVF